MAHGRNVIPLPSSGPSGGGMDLTVVLLILLTLVILAAVAIGLFILWDS